jgi:CHASE2 domain-containing sensor protein
MRDKRTIRLILTACGILAFVLFIDDLGLLGGLNRQTYDFFHRLRGPREPSQNIIVAAVDERTLQHLGRWPIDRKHYATLLDRLKSAEAVGIDIILGRPPKATGCWRRPWKGEGGLFSPFISIQGEN